MTSPRREMFEFEAQKFRDMYDNEVKLKERLMEKLHSAQERASQAQVM